MKTDIDFLSYLAHLLLELEMFQTKIVEKLETHFVFSNFFFFFRKSCGFWDNVEKRCTAGQATDDSMAHALCVLDD